MYLYLLALVVLSWVLLRLRRRAEPVEARSEDPVKSPPAEDPPSTVVLTINGAVHRVENPSPSLTLLAYLRDRCGLTAAKVGCGEGGCGACTVVEHNTDAINACLRLLCQCDGSVITTAEGLGSSRNGFGDIQKAIADGNGSQCGYCTPGWTTAVAALRARGPRSRGDLQKKLDGNICRCTGYRPILEALEGLPDVEDAAPCRDVTTGRACGRACGAPPSRGLSVADDARRLSYVEPTSLPRLYALLDAGLGYGETVLVGGATAAIGVAKYYDDCLGAPWAGGLPPLEDAQLVATKSVPELTKLAAADDGLAAGGAVTIDALSAALRGGLDVAWNAAAAHLDRVANTQVRNSATWAGNLALAARADGFPSDVAVALACLGAELSVSRRDGKTKRRLQKLAVVDVLTGWRAGDVVVELFVPRSPAGTTARCDKVAARHANAHAYVNAGLSVRVASGVVASARLFFGGVAPRTKLFRATAAEAALAGKPVADADAFQAAVAALRAQLPTDDAYATDCAVQLLYKACLLAQPSLPPRVANALRSLAAHRPPSSGARDVAGASDGRYAPACAPRVKLAARLQASGEARYAADEPRACNEVSVAFAFAKRSGTVTAVDVSGAARVLGAVAVYSRDDALRDLVATESLALDDADDLLLWGVGDDVFVGCRVALCVGTSDLAALAMARAVRCATDGGAGGAAALTSAELKAALAAHFSDDGSGKGRKLGLRRGALRVVDDHVVLKTTSSTTTDDRVVLKTTSSTKTDDRVVLKTTSSTKTVSGAFATPLQKHFHMETHSARCVPGEGSRLLLTASTQDPTLTQTVTASLLGLRAADVVVACRRAGGGFGGKLTLHLPAATSVALVAAKLGVPARYHADRRDDMAMTGGREATACDYEVSFDAATGALASYAATFAVEGGHATQDAVGDLSMAVQWSDNCYDSGRHDAKGKVLKTRAPRSSSMRSPGVIQSQCCRELAIVRVAHETRRPVHEVQELNFYKVGQKFPYGSKPLGSPTFNYTIPELYAALKPKLLARLDAVDQFNEANAWRKRGVHVMPTKYIMAMDFWKVPALVNVYGDGSVQVAHGGCELGQGIHTKVAAVAAYALGCDLSLVTVADTSTDKTPNSVATGGSGTSESCCGATLKACATLKKRLAPYVAKHAKWADAVAAALADAVELSATGWNDLRTSESGDDPDYATYGLALAEVEVDCLSGEVEVREVDVRMDQGSSLNSDVDVGQVEGAIVMALGFYLTEHCAVDASGKQSGDGTWEYKPPMVADVPLDLRVSMLARTPNPSAVAVLGSKASGEPPMQLAASVFFALRAAVAAFRRDALGDAAWFDLPVPASPKAIRAALGRLDDAGLVFA